jgi:hypothetical protein
MLWFVWRQHRVEFGGVALITIVIAVGLVYVHWAGASASWWSVAYPVLMVVPVLAGIFIGAPLLSHNAEMGLEELICTQGMTRAEYIWKTILLTLPPVIMAAAVLAAVSSWWMNLERNIVNLWYSFDVWGPVLFSYTLFALVLGAVVGLVLRRIVLSMVLTGVIYVGVRAVVEVFMRPNFEAPLAVRESVPPPTAGDAWILNQVYKTNFGRVLSDAQVPDVLSRVAPLRATHVCMSMEQCLRRLGVEVWTYYQPGSRFWSFQGMEAGLFGGLAIVLLCVMGMVVWRERA